MPAWASSPVKRAADISDVHANASSAGRPGTRSSSCLAVAMAPGAPARRSVTTAATSSSSRSAGTAALSSPMRAASAAGNRLPRRKAARASAGRSLGRHTTEITAGATPIRTSVKPNLALSIATEMSHAAARPMPPATQWPAMRPT
jgi:hypothetical protein